jgi:hypothetical protein
MKRDRDEDICFPPEAIVPGQTAVHEPRQIHSQNLPFLIFEDMDKLFGFTLVFAHGTMAGKFRGCFYTGSTNGPAASIIKPPAAQT